MFTKTDLKKGHKKYYSKSKLLQYFSERTGLVALVDNEIVGYMITQQQTPKKFYVNSIHILKEFQGIGIGVNLLQTAIQKAKDLGYKKIWLDVMTKNKKTVDWYNAQGFVFHSKSIYKMGDTEAEIMIMYKVI